ncbi:MAG: sarcosine oxidase subunit beta family protein [Alphaproteobacteria bacterium]
MANYSALRLVKEAMFGNKGWERAWRDPEPKPSYDVIIVGGGGHGLATAYYLAKEHGITNVAVIEKGYLGGGNVGRNTTIVRSNYELPGNAEFYEKSMQLWEGLSKDLNYNVMFSSRGVLNLGHSLGDMDAMARRGNSMRLHGIDAELFSREDVQHFIPHLDFSENARFPIYGGLFQRRAGNARHDAVAWGLARGADRRGVDIIQNCEVTGYIWDKGKIVGVETSRGPIRANKVGLCAAGNTTTLTDMAGLKMPIESHVLQAFVSESIKPFLDTVVTFGATHFYISQSDKGSMVFGGDLDGYNSYAQRGNLPLLEHVAAAGLSMMPSLSRLKLLRSWGGIMDMSMDGTPIIDKSPIDGLYLNCGWCYGGFKATPASGWCFAHTIAKDEPSPFNTKLRLNRYFEGRSIDELGAGPTPGWH